MRDKERPTGSVKSGRGSISRSLGEFNEVCLNCGLSVENFAMRAHLRCHLCDWVDGLCSRQGCTRCGGTREVDYAGPWPDWEADRVGVWRYRRWQPVAGDGVTLGEGGTPLLRLRAFAPIGHGAHVTPALPG